MSNGKLSAEEIEARRRELLETLRRSGVNEEILQVAQAALTSAALPVQPIPEQPALPLTRAAMQTAIAHTFIVGESLSAGTSPEEIAPQDESERRTILAHSRVVMIGGRNRLQLTDHARGDLLDRARTREDFQQLLLGAYEFDQLRTIGNDPVLLPAAWLRKFLRGVGSDLRTLAALELRAAVEAIERLQHVPDLELPPLAEARRLLGLSELLEPLRVLIGSTTTEPFSADASDRFVGRDRELRELRSFVDALESKGAFETAMRFGSRNMRAAQRLLGVRDEAVLFLIAGGGLGKSSLMAKFVLDHALSRRQPFPFVYLDFDRQLLYPREPLQLLVEAARQVALQFPDDGAQLQGLRQRAMSDTSKSREIEVFAEFRDVIMRITHLRAVPFLVVLDTMEVVQYDARSLHGVVDFVSRLDGGGFDAPFESLRIVAAGRADIPELQTGGSPRSDRHRIVLKPLSIAGARKMANRLGAALMQNEWHERWADLLVGTDKEEVERREPLSIRVAVELVRDATPNERPTIVEQIASDGEAACEGFVGKLYETRVLRHVRNEHARQLAWPGLIVRRVTRDIIAQKLAALCGLDPAYTDAAFEALGNEVWMVERIGAELRHRADLRARTLPFMRRQDAEKFMAVNDAARDYFFARRSDPRENAEWMYHRLLGGEDPESVDADWRDGMSTYLVGAAEDFERNSPQRRYLLSRTASRLLPPEQIRLLSPRLALDHLAHTSNESGSFDDLKINPVLAELAERITTSGVRSSRPHPIRSILLIKTGFWNGETPHERAAGTWGYHADFAQRFKRARTTLTAEDAPASTPDYCIGEPAPLRTLVQDLAYAKLHRLPVYADLDAQVAEQLHRRLRVSGHADFAALRLAVVFSHKAYVDAARTWLECMDAVRWRRSPPTLAGAELRALLQSGKEVRQIISTELASVLEAKHVSWKELVRLRRPICITHPQVRNVLTKSLEMLATRDEPQAEQSLRAFFAARDDDWIVPMSYAAARILDSKRSLANREKRYGSYAVQPEGLFSSVQPQARFPDDALQLLRSADDAADLAGMAQLFAAGNSEHAADLNTLLRHHAAWRAKIEDMLDAGDEWLTSGSSKPPKPSPVVDPEDCQKHRWGGAASRDGRRLEARLREVDKNDFDIDLIVRSMDGSTLEGPVIFHLHDTYPRQQIRISKIRESSWATLEEVNAYGVYTVGAQVKASNGHWTELEFDLARLPELPKRFLER